jgi:hypothetical protein
MAHTEAGLKRERKFKRKKAREERALRVLAEHNEKKEKRKRSKKKDSTEIMNLIDNSLLDTSWFVRDPNEWRPSTYNVDRQIMDFVQWVYCKYDVPQFLLGLFLKSNKTYYMYKRPREFVFRYFDWFLTIAHGFSFAKSTKEYFNKKEAHAFLTAPNLGDINKCFWWAKCRAAGAGHQLTHLICNRFREHSQDSAFWSDSIRFFTRFEDEIDSASFYDVLDYIAAMSVRGRVPAGQEFSLKGRTFSSLIKASNEWHKEQHLKKFGNLNYMLAVSDVEGWRWRDKQEKCTWSVVQLVTSKELYHEGKVMRHCVATYSSRCKDGHSFVFSMTLDDGINKAEKVLTIELDQNRVVRQARGKCNKLPAGRIEYAMRKWMSARNISWGYSKFW